MMTDLELLAAEYDDSDMRDERVRSQVYAELDWVRYHKKWKQGWTAVKFRELFGEWPPQWMKDTLIPQPAREGVIKLVRRWNNRFKRERKKHERDARPTLFDGVAKAAEESNATGGDDGVEGRSGEPVVEGGSRVAGDG